MPVFLREKYFFSFEAKEIPFDEKTQLNKYTVSETTYFYEVIFILLFLESSCV